MEWRRIHSAQGKEMKTNASDEANLQDAEQSESKSKESGLTEDKPASIDVEKTQA